MIKKDKDNKFLDSIYQEDFVKNGTTKLGPNRDRVGRK